MLQHRVGAEGLHDPPALDAHLRTRNPLAKDCQGRRLIIDGSAGLVGSRVGHGGGLVVFESSKQQTGAGLLGVGPGLGDGGFEQTAALGDLPRGDVGQVLRGREAQVLASLREPARVEDAAGPEVLPEGVVGLQVGGRVGPNAALIPLVEQGVDILAWVPLELQRDIELRALAEVRVGLGVQRADAVGVAEAVVVCHVMEPDAREAVGGAVDVVVPADDGAHGVPVAGGLLAGGADVGVDPLHAVIGHVGDDALM